VTSDRLDHWLWVVRLTKTRSLAADAVKAGRVQVNGQPAKPSREVHPGDMVEVRQGAIRTTVVVRGAAPRRVGAAEAAKLYEETPESRETRERFAEQRRLVEPVRSEWGKGRPTKRDRRTMDRLRGRSGRLGPDG
jgi:ribosome-associated heat shock protein Hsp15